MSSLSKVALAGLALVLASPAFAGATSVSSGATAASLQLSALNVVQASATVAPVSGSNPPATYNVSGGAAATNQSWLLVDGIVTDAYETLGLGVVTTQAFSNTSGLASATGTTTIANAGTTLKTTALGVPLVGLGITADNLTSTSTASIAANGSLVGTNASTITNLGISGSILGALSLDLSALANAGPNTVALDLLGLKLVLNEQSQTFVNSRDLFVQTNAIHLTLSNFVYGGSILSGEVILGHSQAEVSAVPEPASWAMMMAGFGAIGFAMRRNRGRVGSLVNIPGDRFTRSISGNL